MNSYIALMFCKKEDLPSYGREVMDAIRAVAGSKSKYAEGAAGVVAVGFKTDKDWDFIRRAFGDLWRAEQRTWVLPLLDDEPMVIDKAQRTGLPRRRHIGVERAEYHGRN